jgi:hypothetical protein
MTRFLAVFLAFTLSLSAQVTAVTGTSPIVSSGGNTPAISCPTCVTSSSGTITYNNHALFSGSAPTVTECGGNPTLGAGSNDNAGFINVGTNIKPAVVCTITFATAFTHAPAMGFTTSKNQVLASPLTITTTAVRFRLSSDMSGGVITWSAF